MKYYCDNARHLICIPYSIQNLRKMSIDLGIKPCWEHFNTTYPHIDIPKRRISEIQSKCEVITTIQLLKLIKDNM